MNTTVKMPTWDNVLNSSALNAGWRIYSEKNDVKEMAQKAGYPYFSFNGDIYVSETGDCTKWTTEMLNKQQNGKKAWFTFGKTTLSSMSILTLCLAIVNIFCPSSIPWFWVFFPLMMGPLFILTILAILLIVAIGCFIAALLGK